MIIDHIKSLLASADPAVSRYDSAEKGEAYTTWRETGDLPDTAGNRHMGGVAFQVDRFTKIEDDATAEAIKQALENDDRIAYEHIVYYEPDTGYIHHVFDCEAV